MAWYKNQLTRTTVIRDIDQKKKMEAALEDIEEKDQIVSKIEEEEATISVLLKEDYKDIKKRSFSEIEDDILGRVKDMPVSDVSLTNSSSQGSSMGGGGNGNEGSSMGGGSGHQ